MYCKRTYRCDTEILWSGLYDKERNIQRGRKGCLIQENVFQENCYRSATEILYSNIKEKRKKQTGR